MNIRERSLLKSITKLNYNNLQWFKQFMANTMEMNGYSKEFYREFDTIAERKELLRELDNISDREKLLQEKGMAN